LSRFHSPMTFVYFFRPTFEAVKDYSPDDPPRAASRRPGDGVNDYDRAQSSPLAMASAYLKVVGIRAGHVAVQRGSTNSPSRAPPINASHSLAVKIRMGPSRSLESRTPTLPSALPPRPGPASARTGGRAPVRQRRGVPALPHPDMSRRRRRPDVGAVGAHTRVAWDRRPSAAGGEQDSLAQQGDGSVRCGGLQLCSDRGSPTIGSRLVGGGVSLWPSRVLLDQLRRLDQVSSANAWIRLGECLYRITLGLVGHDELAARSLGGV
jgi:hypothetical protein